VSATTIAIAQAYPVVVQTFIDSLAGYDQFLVKQDASLLEMATSNAGFGCCEAANKYSVYGSSTQEGSDGKQTALLLAQEESECLGRGCCAPNHAFKMKFYEPRYGTGGKQADKDKGALWTMERDGCCTKWLNCCPPVHACCQQSMTLYAGDVEGEIGSMTGQVIGRAEQPKPFGGCFTPTLHIMERDATEPGAKLEGPTLFGGCTELCFSTEWPISKFESDKKAGDLAMIVKKAPTSMGEAAKELFGDADIYTLNVNPAMNTNQKAIFLASLILTDYMFFERDNGMFAFEDGCKTISCTICLCYCCGTLNPCVLKFSQGGGSDGD
jgi:hypothetical protein